MERIKRLLDRLNLEFPGWIKEIDKNGDFLEKSDEDLRNYFYKTIFDIKAICVEDGLDIDEVIEKISSEEKSGEIISKSVNDCLVYYKALSPIRELSFLDEERAKAFLKDCFENYIIRLDYEVSERYGFLEVYNEGNVKRMLSAIDRLTDYYVERLLIKKEVQKDFKEETGISDTVCSYYAELYEDNFQELKLNMILNKLNNLEEMLSGR